MYKYKHVYWGIDFDALMEKIEKSYKEDPDNNRTPIINIEENLAMLREGKDTWTFYDIEENGVLFACSYHRKAMKINTLNDLIQAYRSRYNQY